MDVHVSSGRVDLLYASYVNEETEKQTNIETLK